MASRTTGVLPLLLCPSPAGTNSKSTMQPADCYPAIERVLAARRRAGQCSAPAPHSSCHNAAQKQDENAQPEGHLQKAAAPSALQPQMDKRAEAVPKRMPLLAGSSLLACIKQSSISHRATSQVKHHIQQQESAIARQHFEQFKAQRQLRRAAATCLQRHWRGHAARKLCQWLLAAQRLLKQHTLQRLRRCLRSWHSHARMRVAFRYASPIQACCHTMNIASVMPSVDMKYPLHLLLLPDISSNRPLPVQSSHTAAHASAGPVAASPPGRPF